MLFLGVQAVQRQRNAIEQLSHANRQLEERSLAAALEQRIISAAETCLREQAAFMLQQRQPIDWTDPGQSRELRVAFQALSERYPVARASFLIEDGLVRIPRTQLALPTPIADRLAGTADRVWSALFVEAEHLERVNRHSAALRLYERIHAGATLPGTAALALSRMARSYERLGHVGAAADLHRRLMEQFPDAYDLSGRPHALVAAVEWHRLTGGAAGTDIQRPFREVQRALAGGRWELDSDAADYFAEKLLVPGPAVPSAPYLELASLGRVLRRGLPPGGEVRAAVWQHATLSSGGEHHEVYYSSQRLSDGGSRTVGLVVNLSYVREQLLPAVASELRVPGQSATVHRATGRGTELRDALPRFEVVLAHTGTTRQGPATADAFVFGGAVAFVLTILLLGVVLLLRDVGRESAMSQLRADLVGGVSHELKTPLTAIRMYGETLSARPDAPREERRMFYEIIVQESDRLTRLVDRVLDFSLIGSGQREYALGPLRLLPLVETVVAQYQPFLHQQGFGFEFVAPGDELATDEIQGDAEAVTRALVNLLDNAVKYSEEDRRIRLWLERADATVSVHVEDHGVGVAPEDRDRLFTRFSRGANRTGRGGYGLGLYLVKHVMEAHRGRVDVWSEPGCGSRFSLTFPLAKARQPPDDSRT